jgi:hypothetical protein
MSHTVSCKIGYDILSCIMKVQVKPYLRQLVMVTATGKGTYWTCTTTKGSSSGSTNWYLGCCFPFLVVGHLRFQHSQCLRQYNASDNRYLVTSITLLRFLVKWRKSFPFPVVGHLRFQHSQCLRQYNASDNRYLVTSITLLRFLVKWRKSRKQRFLIMRVIYSTAF